MMGEIRREKRGEGGGRKRKPRREETIIWLHQRIGNLNKAKQKRTVMCKMDRTIQILGTHGTVLYFYNEIIPKADKQLNPSKLFILASKKNTPIQRIKD